MSRPFVQIDEFLRLTGLSGRDVERVLADGELEGGFTQAGNLVGVFADVVPGRDELVERGIMPSDDYKERLASATAELADEDTGAAGDPRVDGGDGWTIKW